MTSLHETDEVERRSAFSFEQTLENIIRLIQASGMRVFATIDHAANAREVGLEMLASTVLIYGKAEGGTPIMIASPRSALHLPLHVLIREGADGNAIISFRPIAPVLETSGVPANLAARLEAAQQMLLKAIEP